MLQETVSLNFSLFFLLERRVRKANLYCIANIKIFKCKSRGEAEGEQSLINRENMENPCKNTTYSVFTKTTQNTKQS